MTLTDALRVLHEAGEIASPWMAGMATLDEDRILCSDHADGLVFVDLGTAREWVDPAGLGQPDPTDPATKGCLLALLREATGDPTMFVSPPSSGSEDWWVRWSHPFSTGPTDGDAIAAALIARAEEVQRAR